MSGKGTVASTVGLECRRRPMERAAVQLDDEPRLRPNAIGLDVDSSYPHVKVPPRSGQSMAAEESREESLEFAAGDTGAESDVGEKRSNPAVPSPAWVLCDRPGEDCRCDQASHFGFSKRARQDPAGHDGGQI
jgi:hypothetical protein